MNAEDAALLRSQAVRGVVFGSNDAGGSQAIDVETHEGVTRSGVEVLQPYGLASRPAAGGLVVLIAIGGDPTDLVALPPAGGARYGVEEGEVALYTDEGTRVHLRGGGLIEVGAATEVKVTVGGTTFTVSAEGVAIIGKLTVTETIEAGGNIISAAEVHDAVGNLR